MLLYNCGLWTLTKRLNEQLDVWQRRKLHYIFGVHYPHCVSNQILYEKSKQQPISRVCRRRGLLWSGHVVREGPDSVSYGALTMAIDMSQIKRPRGRPRLRWIDVVKSDISPLGRTLADCLNTIRDKQLWLDFVDKCTSVLKKNDMYLSCSGGGGEVMNCEAHYTKYTYTSHRSGGLRQA